MKIGFGTSVTIPTRRIAAGGGSPFDPELAGSLLAHLNNLEGEITLMEGFEPMIVSWKSRADLSGGITEWPGSSSFDWGGPALISESGQAGVSFSNDSQASPVCVTPPLGSVGAIGANGFSVFIVFNYGLPLQADTAPSYTMFGNDSGNLKCTLAASSGTVRPLDSDFSWDNVGFSSMTGTFNLLEYGRDNDGNIFARVNNKVCTVSGNPVLGNEQGSIDDALYLLGCAMPSVGSGKEFDVFEFLLYSGNMSDADSVRQYLMTKFNITPIP